MATKFHADRSLWWHQEVKWPEGRGWEKGPAGGGWRDGQKGESRRNEKGDFQEYRRREYLLFEQESGAFQVEWKRREKGS
jgi:hypothetical protein